MVQTRYQGEASTRELRTRLAAREEETARLNAQLAALRDSVTIEQSTQRYLPFVRYGTTYGTTVPIFSIIQEVIFDFVMLIRIRMHFFGFCGSGLSRYFSFMNV